MKQGWEIKYFKDVCTLIGGSQPSKNDFIYMPKSGYIRLIQVRDYRTDNYITYIPKEKAKRFCTKDDIMIGRYGPPIFGIFKGLEGAYNVALMKAVVNEKICDKDYFYFFLQTGSVREFVEHSSKRAAGQDGVRKELLDKFPVPIPSIPEQQRIVSILNEAFAAIAKAKANAEQNLKNVQELFESYLQVVFENGNWETKKFNEVCEISSKLIDPRKSEYQNLIHVGAGNIDSVSGKLSNLKTAKEENLISGKFLFDESMVLYSKIRPYLMKVVNCDFQGLCSADIYPLKPFEKVITKDYLYNLLLTKEFTEYAILGSQRAGMPKVNRGRLFAYKFKLPSLIVQQNIVRQLDALRVETNRLEAIYQQKLLNLEELRKTILQKAFAGELKTKNEIAV